MPVKIGSLFSGIGSLDLGVIDALGGNAETVWFVEQDDFCQQVLSKRFPGTRIYDDVNNLPYTKMESPDILVGGFPCQDLSVAGHAKGIKEGTRSGLFLRMWELAAFDLYPRPRFVLFENVPAIRTRGLNVVADEVTSCGWTLEWFCLSASSVGAWHKRERWWAIAHREEPLFDDYKEVGVNHLGLPFYSLGDRSLMSGHWFSLQQDLFSPQQIEMPKTGMARNGMLFQRSFSDHSSDRGWPTPTATDYKDGGSEHSIRHQVKRKGNGVRLGSYVPASENGLLPTPVRGDGHKLGSHSLSRFIESGGRRYSADDHRGTGEPIEWLPGKLNPDWVEPLMGLPSGFTDLEKDVSAKMIPSSSWRDGSWEEGIPRLTERKDNRVSRVKALGNSVVPQCAAAAFSILRGRFRNG